jgi:hypothetical protein
MSSRTLRGERCRESVVQGSKLYNKVNICGYENMNMKLNMNTSVARWNTRGENAARVILRQGDALVVGVTSVRERERVSLFVSSFSRATLPPLA